MPITDTDRLEYLLQFLSIVDIGDDVFEPGVIVESESLEMQLTYGPQITGPSGKMRYNLLCRGMSIRDAIDRAISEHGADRSEEHPRCELSISEKQKKLLKEVIDLFGWPVNMLILFEEMAELTKAFTKYERYNLSDASAIREEIADVTIMLDQMRIVFDTENEIDRIISEKLGRLEERIERFKVHQEK